MFVATWVVGEPLAPYVTISVPPLPRGGEPVRTSVAFDAGDGDVAGHGHRGRGKAVLIRDRERLRFAVHEGAADPEVCAGAHEPTGAIGVCGPPGVVSMITPKLASAAASKGAADGA
jgi:hypothetical protein